MDKNKKYEDALERCKKEFNFNNLAYSHEEIRQRLEQVFPELKENEDEKIRKELISYIKSSSAISNKKWIAWLEKQGEQKLIWSEEDEIYYKSALWHIENSTRIKGNVYNWLKSLRNRIKEK